MYGIFKPTFTIERSQMWVNIPYMDGMGLILPVDLRIFSKNWSREKQQPVIGFGTFFLNKNIPHPVR